ncbi:hypothetical protein [Nocardioides sp. MH1]|uniref:hypothetical protein n=1 Tax=Nocardioides sp. MH1 TaxID=3242490 RepID=UPI0035209841
MGATGVIYTGILMAVSLGMTAWRVVAVQGKITLETDRALAACLICSIGLFVAFLLPHYVPGIRVP